ncbi:unnamed protein product [Coregonus sp. 'balchen']|nr:unnamed protein product [Coregonus sp. 'balchen']
MAIQTRKRRWLGGWAFPSFALLLLHLKGISGQIRYSIQEELKVGTAVGNIAKDLRFDTSRQADRNLRILSGTKHELFQVNRRDGTLLVNHRLDREELCVKTTPCFINLKAVIENPLEMHQVTVEIIDVNDNSPKFPEETYNLEILESALAGTRFQVEGAHDSDVGLNALQSYSLSHNQYFRVETEEFGEDGKIPFLILQKPLDRELISQHTLLLTALDGGKPPKSGGLNITVIVSDINDNAPVCDKQKYTVTIKESAPAGTFLIRLNASDTDEGLNGEVKYSLRGKFRGMGVEPFELDSKTGELKVKGGLDFEEKQSVARYDITITAKDLGTPPLTSTKVIQVEVVDVNDNNPLFTDNPYTFYVVENNKPGISIFSVSASDFDEDANYDGTLCHSIQYRSGDKRYMLVGPRMSIGSTIVPGSNGNTLVVPEHRRRASGEHPVQIRRQTVHVSWTQNEYRFYYSPGQQWEYSSATRPQEESFRRGLCLIVCLTMGDGRQRRRWEYWWVALRFSLLLCFGEQGSAQIRYSIPEEVKEGSVIGNVAKDLGLDVSTLVERRFRIVSGSNDALFQINQNNGVLYVHNNIDREELCDGTGVLTGDIRVKGEVDFEDTEVYKLDVQASDKGQPPLTVECRVIIKIIDVNDNKPEIDVTSLSNTVPEDSKPGTVISLISVTDKDSGINGKVISSISENVPFELTPSYKENLYSIVTRGRLDRELVSHYDITITATDCGQPPLSTFKTLSVQISDVNDNSPEFFQNPVELANGSAESVEEIPRNVNAGHLVTKVRAYDADIGYNGWLLFSLQEVTDHSLFALDRYTGQIRTLRPFTETDEADHKLVILVKDNGNVSLSATATVIINVVEPKEAFAASDVKSAVKDEEENSVTFYLIITLGLVSALFLASIIVLILMQCSKAPDISSKYLQEANYDGTLCHSIQYRSGDKRYMLVGPRMSIGSTIVPGSNGNTLVVPEHRRRASGESFLSEF